MKRKIEILYDGAYYSMLEEVLTGTPAIEEEIIVRTAWFSSNPDDTRIDNHPLHKSLEGQWAFSITDDVRIVYEWVGKTTVRFLAIGGHGIVYPSN
jgi:mRNA-degrading endonuclease YafQ of YafQ-DinJ toxin-antitoxin module